LRTGGISKLSLRRWRLPNNLSFTLSDVRFQFGKNWLDYLLKIDEERVHHAVAQLHASLGDLTGKSFLDVGCGSGIHSLAAVRLGACRVHSFDFDPQSVDCARATKRRFAPTAVWEIERGSALDETYLRALGHFDFIYSWGVLHHTGNMWRSLELLTQADATTIMISLYADQGIISRLWRTLKRIYSSHPLSRRPIQVFSLITMWGPKFVFQPHRVVADWKFYGRNRGMSAWHDVVDWAGGYPYEFAKPDDVTNFFRSRGFDIVSVNLPKKGVIRVNEFVFQRLAA